MMTLNTLAAMSAASIIVGGLWFWRVWREVGHHLEWRMRK